MKFTFARFLWARLREAYEDCYGRLAIEGGGQVHSKARIYRQTWCPISVGEGSLVDAFATLYCANGSNTEEKHNSTIRIGQRSFIGSYSDVRAGDGTITIGDDTLIAQHVSIVASGHGIERDQLIRLQPPPAPRNVSIGSDVWIGAGARILPGVCIGDHAVVGAGSVVTHDAPAGGVMMGVPARMVRER